MTKMNDNKRGFNLIEIAIVLAVIGLVIGGIYVAASAVTENNRRQVTQKELLQIVQNIRTAYASQTSFAALTHDQIVALNIMPGELTNTGAGASGTFQNSYNGTVDLAAPSTTTFSVTFNKLSQGACTDTLAKSFGTSAAISQIGLTGATANGTSVYAATGITAVAAAGACNQSGNANAVVMTFNLH